MLHTNTEGQNTYDAIFKTIKYALLSPTGKRKKKTHLGKSSRAAGCISSCIRFKR